MALFSTIVSSTLACALYFPRKKGSIILTISRNLKWTFAYPTDEENFIEKKKTKNKNKSRNWQIQLLLRRSVYRRFSFKFCPDLQIIEKSNCLFVSSKRAESSEGIKGAFSCSGFDIAPGRCLPEPKNVIGSHHMSEKTKHKSAVSFLSTNSKFCFFATSQSVFVCKIFKKRF